MCELRRDTNIMCKLRTITVLHNENYMHMIVGQGKNDHKHEPNASREKIANVLNTLKEDTLKNPEKKTCHIIEKCVKETRPEIILELPSANNLRQMISESKRSNPTELLNLTRYPLK